MQVVNQMTEREKAAYKVIKIMPKPLVDVVIPPLNKIRVDGLKRLQTPLNLVLYITDYCNAKCEHCFYWKNLNKKVDELKLDELKKIIKSLKHPLELAILTGGEPFLRKDIAEICEAFYTINDTERINIATNGFFVEKTVNLAETLMKKYPRKRLTIFVSIDGLEDTHDRIRGIPGLFKKCVETIKKVVALQEKYEGLTVFVNTTVFSDNYKELAELNETIRSLGAIHKFNILRDNHSVGGIDTSILNDFDPKSSILPDLNELENVYKLVDERAEGIPGRMEALKIRYSVDMLKERKMKVKCLGGITDGVLFTDGNIGVCEPTKPFANIREYELDFEKAWNSEPAQKRKNQVSKCFCLQSCNLLNAMKYDTKTILNVLR